LTPLADPPDFGYSTKFQLPSDLLVIRQVSDNEDMRKIDYVKEAHTVLANAAILFLKYTLRISNENLFSPTFTYAFAHKLAASIAIPLTENTQLKQDMESLALMYVEEGGAIDGTQTKVGRATASKLLNARLRG